MIHIAAQYKLSLERLSVISNLPQSIVSYIHTHLIYIIKFIYFRTFMCAYILASFYICIDIIGDKKISDNCNQDDSDDNDDNK
jgi:hypothetical protein